MNFLSFISALCKHSRKSLIVVTTFLAFMFASQLQAMTKTDFSIITLDNQVIKVEQGVIDKPTYMVFWATWCPSCLREVPHLKAIYQQYKNEINFVAINVDRTHFWYNLTTEESKKPVREYLEKQGINYPVALDDDNTLSELFNVKGTPTQVLLSKTGEVKAKFNLTPENINEMLETLIN